MADETDEGVETKGTLLETSDTDSAPADSAPADTTPAEGTEQDAIDVKMEGFDISQVPEKFVDKETGVVKLDAILKSNSELENALHARAPESYDITDVLEEHQLVFENEEQEAEVTDLFKSHRISNEAAKDILAMYGKRINALTEQLGSPNDLENEMTKLRSTWGTNTDNRLQEIADYAGQKNLAPEVYSTSPLKTAAGMELLYSMIKNTTGPKVIRDAETPVDNLETQLTELMTNPLYYVQNAEGDKVRKHATALSEAIAKKQRS